MVSCDLEAIKWMEIADQLAIRAESLARRRFACNVDIPGSLFRANTQCGPKGFFTVTLEFRKWV